MVSRLEWDASTRRTSGVGCEHSQRQLGARSHNAECRLRLTAAVQDDEEDRSRVEKAAARMV